MMTEQEARAHLVSRIKEIEVESSGLVRCLTEQYMATYRADLSDLDASLARASIRVDAWPDWKQERLL